MDNPQERLLGWLGGIMDGEGSILIQCYTKKSDRKIRLTPVLTIVNTNLEILNQAVRLFDSMNVDKRHAIRLMFKPDSYASKRQCYQIRVDGFEPVYQVLLVLKDYLIGKKSQAELMIRFIETRRQNLVKRFPLGRIIRNGYSKDEIDLYNRIKILNGKVSSETICQAPNYIGEDRVRTDRKLSETLGN